MVYAGTINKNIVAQLQSADAMLSALPAPTGTASGPISGSIPQSTIGYVGDVDSVDAAFLTGLLMLNKTLVFAPITHDGKGLLLNTNADTIAQELARGLCTII